jgi:hypothetical protein
LASLDDAVKVILAEAEKRIDLGDCFDRKLTPIYKDRGKAAHLSVGRILPGWRRVRIVALPAGEDAVILVVKRLRVAGDER